VQRSRRDAALRTSHVAGTRGHALRFDRQASDAKRPM
jgi:hypothetical protein